MMQPKTSPINGPPIVLDLVTKIDEWADQYPGRTAVVFQGQPVTYAELSSRRKALAKHLLSKGLGVGSKIGIHLPREPDLIVALTAVLSIGAVFIPLPPDSPQQRNELISRLAHLDAVIKPRSVDLSQWSMGASLDIEAVDWCDSTLFFEPLVDDLSLAYILFTSGSTGLPKGVMVRRQNLAYFLSAINEVINFPAWGALVSTTTYGFDISILEFFLPLAQGGTLYLASEQQSRDGQAIAHLLDHCDKALLQGTPATWRLLIAAGWPRTCAVGALCGGETLPVGLGEIIFRSARAAWNLYGPTETTIWSFCHRLQASDFTGSATSVPIGQPLPGTRFRLSASQDSLESELVIGGPGVSAGYFNRDDLTAEKFQGTETGGASATYYTGDRVQQRPDNSLVFIGRKDRQLKLNGYRIEPGEIESALHKSGLVSQSFVTLVEHAPDDHRLAAYVVLDNRASGQRVADAGVWLDVWEAAYLSAQKNEVASASSGYTSSFSGELIPDSDLREWVQATASRVLEFAGHSVLDIGCGIGMTGAVLLENGLHRYVGCDVSEVAVERARLRLDQVAGSRASCAVMRRAAHELGTLDEAPFDVVLLNSVIQYFPDMAYLVGVLEKAADLCRKGGVIVIGDVPYASLKQVLSAAASRTRKKLKRTPPVVGEGELWLDPLQIKQLAYAMERVVHVETELRTGQGKDEMTRYRYDVIIRLDMDDRASLAPVARYSYRHERLHERDLGQWLASTPSTFVLSGVPNARISLDLQLSEGGSSIHPDEACDPEYIRQWAASRHLQAKVRWSDNLPAGTMDIFVGPHDSLDPTFEPRPALGDMQIEPAPVREIGDVAMRQEFIEQLKASLRAHVPSYMIPAHFIFLERFPLTFNDKLDVAALERFAPRVHSRRSPADNQPLSVKQRLTQIWSDILMTASIHPTQSFFAQGGSSLLIVNLTRELNDAFDLRLQVTELFEENSLDAQTRLINQKLGSDTALSMNPPTSSSSVDRRTAAIRSAARRRQKQL